MNNPTTILVSIVIPVYNAEGYLAACLDSILEQDYPDVEILIVNDGSTDSSQIIIDKYDQADPRIHAIQQENQGPSAARNRALAIASGQLLFLLDADDSVTKTGLSSLVSIYRETGVDLVIGGFRKIDLNEQPVEGFVNPSPGLQTQTDLVELSRLYLRAPNRHLTFAYAWGRLFRMSLIRETALQFDEQLHSYEDVIFNFQYLQHCESAYISDTETYRFLVRNDHSSLTFDFGTDPERLLGYNHAIQRIQVYIESSAPNLDVTGEVANAMVSLTIIQCIRICVNLTPSNFSVVHNTLNKLVSDPVLSNALHHYDVEPGNSALIPALMKYKMTTALMLVCALRGWKRYGRKHD